MASKRKLEEEFFTCVICQELFQNPVTLHCNHHFCQDCLTSYTQTRADAVAAGCLPCPSCREQTKVPAPHKPVTEWAAQLKTGFFLQGLMDAIRTSETNEEIKKREAQKATCSAHAGKPLELYCQDCKLVICSLCSGIDHRACKSVLTAEDAAQIADSKLADRMKIIQKNIRLLKSRADEKRTMIENCYEVEGQIEKTCQAAIDKIFEEAKSLKEKLKSLKDKRIRVIADVLEEELHKLQMTEEESRKVSQASMIDKIYACNSLDPVEYVKDIDLAEHEQPLASFSGCEQELVAAIERCGIGSIVMNPTQSEREDVVKAKLILTNSFDVRMLEEKTVPFIRDVIANACSLPEVIVVVDSGNRCVKKFVRGSGQCLILPAIPCKLTKKNQRTAAVTLENKSVITFKYLPTLVLDHVFTTEKSYYGITYLGNSTFAVSCTSPTASIDVIDNAGRILRTVSDFRRQGDVFLNFSTPVFLCTTPDGNIVVSDYTTRRVTILSKELGIVNTYRSMLKNPLGVTSGDDSEVYVVDREQRSVIQMSSEATFVRRILTSEDGMIGPTCIFAQNDKVFVAVENRHCLLMILNAKIWGHVSRNDPSVTSVDVNLLISDYDYNNSTSRGYIPNQTIWQSSILSGQDSIYPKVTCTASYNGHIPIDILKDILRQRHNVN